MDKLIDNRCLVLNWVPILLHTDEDIEFATRKRTKVLKILYYIKPTLDKTLDRLSSCLHLTNISKCREHTMDE